MKKNLLLLSLGLVMLACTDKKEQAEKIEKYKIINPIVSDTVIENEYAADIRSIQNVEIRSHLKGYLDKIHVDEGQYVKQGQALFSLNNRHYLEELTKAKSNLRIALSEAKTAELEVKNTKELVEKNIVSKIELEIAQAKYESANARVEEAKANESTAKLNLQYTEIKAPFDGMINRIPFKVGSLIDEGSLLTTISNNKQMHVYFNVSEKEYIDYKTKKRKRASNTVQLILANNKPYNYEGEIETLEGEIDRNTGNIAFRAKFNNPEELLRHGSSGRVVLKRELENAMLIPQKSTFEIQDKNYVFVVGPNNEVMVKPFKAKYRLPLLYIVESGISKDDKIIFEGIQHLKQGDVIEPELHSLKELMKNESN